MFSDHRLVNIGPSSFKIKTLNQVRKFSCWIIEHSHSCANGKISFEIKRLIHFEPAL